VPAFTGPFIWATFDEDRGSTRSRGIYRRRICKASFEHANPRRATRPQAALRPSATFDNDPVSLSGLAWFIPFSSVGADRYAEKCKPQEKNMLKPRLSCDRFGECNLRARVRKVATPSTSSQQAFRRNDRYFSGGCGASTLAENRPSWSRRTHPGPGELRSRRVPA
jgi:hypothetical protein